MLPICDLADENSLNSVVLHATAEVPRHPVKVDAATTRGYVAAAASLFQTTDPARAGRPVSDVLLALAHGDVERASKRLLVLESGAGVHRFRRKLANSCLPDDVVLATATLLARDADKDLDRQGRVELLMRRLLVVSGDSGEQILSRSVSAPLLEAVCEGRRAPADVRATALAALHEANAKLHSCDSVDEVFSKWVIADVLGFKASLRGAFRDPDVLYASTAFSVEVENHLEMLAGLEDLPAGDVSHRLWKLELELRTMFRQMSSSECYRAGAFEKVDWRRFKWRQGLVRLRDPKVQAKPLPWRSIRLGAIAMVCAAVLPQFIPGESPLRAGDLVASEISPMLISSVTNGEAFALRADPDQWKPMTNERRAEEAGWIADRLANRGVRDALIQVNDAIAIRIEAGAVAFVEKSAEEAAPRGTPAAASRPDSEGQGK